MSKDIVAIIAQEVRNRFLGEGSGHDWPHIERVWKMARVIGRKEGADMIVTELGALLHDIADWKFHEGDESAGPREARRILEVEEVAAPMVDHVCDIVVHVSYKGAGVPDAMATLEGKVVQDADRLDAMGAIGIARAFTYGGHKGRPMYDPAIKAALHTTSAAYFKNNGPTINHFYEKLFLLKDRMHTPTGRALAQSRHIVMEEYLKRFFAEHEGIM